MDYLEWGFVHHLADINVEFHVPPLIPTASVTQPTCAAIWKYSVTTQSGVECLDGTTYQASNTFSGLLRKFTLYVRSVKIIAALQRHQQWLR
jgi:hypothetical protein